MMDALYRKDELKFSLVWIVLYVVLLSVSDGISESLGVIKIITAPVCGVLVVLLWRWIRKNGLSEKYGLCAFRGRARNYLFFVPLIIIASTNLWHGASLRFSAVETVLYVTSMLCVGFIEEIIFRGFLFQALRRENIKSAVIISSVTFGIGHIVNLLNGAEVLSTLLQICYACAIGFLFTIIFYTGKSLVPCILTHSAVNSLNAFAVEGTVEFDVLVAVVLTIVSIVYALWIVKMEQPVG